MKNLTTVEVDECCKPQVRVSERRCPECGNRGKPVQDLTVSVFVKNPSIFLHPERLPPGAFSMCETKSCDVVYFNSHEGSAFRKNELRTKVWQKEDDPAVPACYCFNNSVNSIGREIERRGSTDVLARISAEVKAGNCRCEVTNPQGRCCLGNVTKAIRIAKEKLGNPLVVA
ncbi:MAG: (2Fe-2S)-binding protein [Thaumarchaeota archaeon]|nr:(2Fe-2S)-binding protein [Nitrososphaerota archaeon]